MKNQLSAVRTLIFAGVLVIAGTTSFAQEYLPALGSFEFSGEQVVLPMTMDTGHPKVNVDLGDGVQQPFIVDTGASVNVIDAALAESLGYEVVGETEIGAPGGPQIIGNIVRVPLAHVGGAVIKDAEFVTMDLVTFTGGTTQGVLGMGLFRDHLLTYDYGRKEIRVSRDSLSANDPDVISYNNVSGHIQIDMEVAGTTVTSHIDTGSMGAFTLPVELRASLPLQETDASSVKARLVGGDRDISFARLEGDIWFAGKQYATPDVGFIDPSPGVGNVGSQILGDFVVSIDQANELIRFQESAQRSVAGTGSAPRRLGVRFRGVPGGGALTVAGVEAGSLAEKAGLMPGDVLMTLNDKPAEDYDMAALGALLRGSEPLQLEVDRDGNTQAIAIQ